MKTMNARTTIVTALLMGTAACCAHTQTPLAKTETTWFMGYRLEVELDDVGAPLSAKAFDPQGKEVPTVIVPLHAVSVCLPRPVGPATGASPSCEPLSFLPEGTNFKSGSGTTCYRKLDGHVIAYGC